MRLGRFLQANRSAPAWVNLTNVPDPSVQPTALARGTYKQIHVVVTVDEFGNTSSTTHFLALWKYLREGRFAPDDRVLLLSIASGLEVGIVIFKVDELVGRYGHDN